ncbi:MAG: type II toxin-antitoxin system VapC family toxin [Candidatus Bathyarchaeia archaeon]
MKFLFDSSAIFRAIKENKIKVLTGNSTLELARYELENIIWKGYALQAKVSDQEAKLLLKTIRHTLDLMEVLGVAGSEEEIFDTAMKLKITFYDASYVYFAEKKELQLVTEDSQLIKRIAPTVKVSTLAQVKE